MLLSDSGSFSIEAEAFTQSKTGNPSGLVEVLSSEVRMEGNPEDFLASGGEETFVNNLSEGLGID